MNKRNWENNREYLAVMGHSKAHGEQAYVTLIADNKSPVAPYPAACSPCWAPFSKSQVSSSPLALPIFRPALFSYISFKNFTSPSLLMFPPSTNPSNEESRPAIPDFHHLIPWPHSAGKQALSPSGKGHSSSSVPSSWANPQACFLSKGCLAPS